MYITGDKIGFFTDLYNTAKAHQKYSTDYFLACREQYEASKKTSQEGTLFKAIRPLSYEMVESQVSTVIPPLMCSPERWNQGRARNALTLEKTIMQDLQKNKIAKLNDEDERNTYIYGTSILLVEWDETIRKHGEAGAPVISVIRPDKFIAQPGVNEIQRQEYCFIDFDTTVQECARKYDVSEADIIANQEPRTNTDEEHQIDEDSMVVHCCYYKNEDGKISEFCWSDKLCLLDYEDIYSRRRSVCQICGRSGLLSEDGQTCECGGDIVDMPVEYEELTKDIVLDAGMVVKTRRVIPALSPVIREGQLVMENKPTPVMAPDGSQMMENVDGVPMPMSVLQPTPKMEPTRIPWYNPSLFPVVARKNTSDDSSIFGQSDMDKIKDIQDEYNKVKSRMYEKVQGSTVFPVIPDRAAIHLDNTINAKVVKIPDGVAVNQFGVVNTSVDIKQDMLYLQFLYDEAQRTLGITDSFVGQADTTAKSGKAKQIQVNQAAGRLESKRQMKYLAYTEMANIIFQYRLAYSDEPVSVKTTDEFGMTHDSAFNRYDYVEYDEKTGVWYYDDRYIWTVNAAATFESDPAQTWEGILSAFQSGMYGMQGDVNTMLRVWMMLEKAHYPNATEQVTYWQNMLMQQRMAMAQPGMLSGNPGQLQTNPAMKAGSMPANNTMNQKGVNGNGNNIGR